MDSVFTPVEILHIEKLKRQIIHEQSVNKLISREAIEDLADSLYQYPSGTDVIIAGGFFVSSLLEEPFKDIDVFVLNNNVSIYRKLIEKTLQRKHRMDATRQYLKNPHILSVATDEETWAQYILTDYTSREELLKSFDFRHCTISYDHLLDKLFITRGAYDDIMLKRLTLNNGNQPSEWRIQKMFKKGWEWNIEDKSRFKPMSVADINIGKPSLENWTLSMDDVWSQLTTK